MEAKKILIISSVFFPRNSPRANRATELAKEFSRQGHEVLVIANLGSFDYTDFKNEFNLNIKDFGKMKFVDISSDLIQVKSNLLKKISSRLFNNLFEFPYIEYTQKTYKVINKLECKFDLLISIAVPYTIHWGVALAKGRVDNFAKTWVADCGDPFIGNPNLKKPFYFKYIEKWFCKKTDYISVPTENSRQGYFKEFSNKIKVIPQGFRIEEYQNLPLYIPNKVPTFIYAGALYKNLRDPRPFLDYLLKFDLDFKFIIYTNNEDLIKDYLILFKGKLIIKKYIPRKKVIEEFAKADFLINFNNKEAVQTPSKLIDYSISARPIFNISNSKDFKYLKYFLNGNYERFKYEIDIEKYNIKNVCNSFLDLIK